MVPLNWNSYYAAARDDVDGTSMAKEKDFSILDLLEDAAKATWLDSPTSTHSPTREVKGTTKGKEKLTLSAQRLDSPDITTVKDRPFFVPIKQDGLVAAFRKLDEQLFQVLVESSIVILSSDLLNCRQDDPGFCRKRYPQFG